MQNMNYFEQCTKQGYEILIIVSLADLERKSRNAENTAGNYEIKVKERKSIRFALEYSQRVRFIHPCLIIKAFVFYSIRKV